MLQRYQDVSEQISRLGGSPIVPASDISILDMQATIRELERKRAAAATPINDERLRAASSAFEAAVHKYHLLRAEVVES
jgi:hypothetical protein